MHVSFPIHHETVPSAEELSSLPQECPSTLQIGSEFSLASLGVVSAFWYPSAVNAGFLFCPHEPVASLHNILVGHSTSCHLCAGDEMGHLHHSALPTAHCALGYTLLLVTQVLRLLLRMETHEGVFVHFQTYFTSSF